MISFPCEPCQWLIFEMSQLKSIWVIIDRGNTKSMVISKQNDQHVILISLEIFKFFTCLIMKIFLQVSNTKHIKLLSLIHNKNSRKIKIVIKSPFCNRCDKQLHVHSSPGVNSNTLWLKLITRRHKKRSLHLTLS